jgi:phytanoyl-CoA hydroxylase
MNAFESTRLLETAGPRYASRFGGLWPDLSNAGEVIQGKLELGMLTPQDAEHLSTWISDGCVVLEQAVPHDVIDRILGDVEDAWQGRWPSVRVEHQDGDEMKVSPIHAGLRGQRTKILDLNAVTTASIAATFAPAVRRFLGLLFERPALAFQSLVFEQGTAIPLHQDTAFVGVRSPLELCAAWIALEDIQPGTGELQYYLGSHRIEERLFDDSYKLMPIGFPSPELYLQSLHDRAQALGLELVKFRPRKGDVLIWHAELIHGGSPVRIPGSSRRSLISHYCPVDVEPGYFRYWEHSDIRRHDAGCYHCWALR